MKGEPKGAVTFTPGGKLRRGVGAIGEGPGRRATPGRCSGRESQGLLSHPFHLGFNRNSSWSLSAPINNNHKRLRPFADTYPTRVSSGFFGVSCQSRRIFFNLSLPSFRYKIVEIAKPWATYLWPPVTHFLSLSNLSLFRILFFIFFLYFKQPLRHLLLLFSRTDDHQI